MWNQNSQRTISGKVIIDMAVFWLMFMVCTLEYYDRPSRINLLNCYSFKYI
jgi:hypothetical protein